MKIRKPILLLFLLIMVFASRAGYENCCSNCMVMANSKEGSEIAVSDNDYEIDGGMFFISTSNHFIN